MTTAINATAKDVTANSYVTLAEANTYFGDRMFSEAWVSAGDDNQAKALLWAAKILDTRVSWKGAKSTLGQALSWPRAYVEDPEYAVLPPATAFSLDKLYIDADTIPKFLKWAQCEQALALVGSDITLDSATTGFSQLSVGPISVSIDRIDKARVLPRPVRELIAKYGRALDGGSTTAKLLRA